MTDDDKIEGDDANKAAESFKEKHRLCPHCLKLGTSVAVEFNSHIHVDRLPSSRV